MLKRIIKKFDIAVAFHNHVRKQAVSDRRKRLQAFIEGRDKRFGLCIDFGFPSVAASPGRRLLQFAARIMVIPLKDVNESLRMARRLKSVARLDIPPPRGNAKSN
jgi:hypothetical protein